jgi:hypothetical protein
MGHEYSVPGGSGHNAPIPDFPYQGTTDHAAGFKDGFLLFGIPKVQA